MDPMLLKVLNKNLLIFLLKERQGKKTKQKKNTPGTCNMWIGEVCMTVNYMVHSFIYSYKFNQFLALLHIVLMCANQEKKVIARDTQIAIYSLVFQVESHSRALIEDQE